MSLVFLVIVQLVCLLRYTVLMDATKANEIVNSLTTADILQAYSGKPGCACGCNGTYVITAESRKEADTSRGYPHSDEDVNPNQLKRVLKQVQKHAAMTGHGEKCEADYAEDLNNASDDVYWNVADDLQYITYQAHARRVYTVYLTSAARRARGVSEGFDLK